MNASKIPIDKKYNATNMASDSNVRRRKPEATTPHAAAAANGEPRVVEIDTDEEEEIKQQQQQEQKKRAKNPKSRISDEDTSNPWLLDFLRVVTFLFLASSGLSYLISGGETFFWGMTNPPNYMKVDWWKSQLRGPLYLTPAELAAFDGSDETKPIYLAINGTIYDVSANRPTYGPGGSYHVFAGVDASRGFVTGCFAEDRTADMRGVEDMFLPLDDHAVDRRFTKAEFEALRASERAAAEKKVFDALDHWTRFFANSKKYSFVGYVKRPAGWPGTEPRRKLCAQAQEGRKKRKAPAEAGPAKGQAS